MQLWTRRHKHNNCNAHSQGVGGAEYDYKVRKPTELKCPYEMKTKIYDFFNLPGKVTDAIFQHTCKRVESLLIRYT